MASREFDGRRLFEKQTRPRKEQFIKRVYMVPGPAPLSRVISNQNSEISPAASADTPIHLLYLLAPKSAANYRAANGAPIPRTTDY
jgi:hypothetical protein